MGMRRLRIHLSTAVILSITAGGLIALNTRPRNAVEVGSTLATVGPTDVLSRAGTKDEMWLHEEPKGIYRIPDSYQCLYGWPCYALDVPRIRKWTKNGDFYYNMLPLRVWSYWGIFANVLVGLAILAATATGSERLFRRRAHNA